MKKILVSKFDLKYSSADNLVEIPFCLSKLYKWRFFPEFVRLLKTAKDADGIFISNPQFEELLYCFVVKRFVNARIPIMYFDLIMRKPKSFAEQLLAIFKRKLLSAVDVFIFIHKNISNYEKYYGVDRLKSLYVPFKANNFDLSSQFVPTHGDYILSLGASQRDYRTLIKAVTGLPIKLKIILPAESIKKHNAEFLQGILPPNVEHVSAAVDRHAWSELIAGSRFVVVPLLPHVIQPAGISVYLEAMILKKAVIITKGPSTDEILTDELAIMVPASDVEVLREAIESLWNDSSRTQQLGEAAYKYSVALGGHDRLLADIRRIIEVRVH